MTALETLVAGADAAYDREDEVWFFNQATDDLVALWAIACDINQGAAWDDEVYEALAARGHFDAPPAPPRVPGRPDVQCAFPMGDRWCRLQTNHGGDHEPSTRTVAELDGATPT